MVAMKIREDYQAAQNPWLKPTVLIKVDLFK
jgi:hypothetical protein